MERADSRTRYRLTIIIVLLVLTAAMPLCAQDSGRLNFSITEWDTGTLEYGTVVQQNVEITNNTADNVIIDLISTCSCMTVEPESFELGSGETGDFIIYFDSHDDEGGFEKLLIIASDSEAMPKGFFVVTGVVNPPAETADSTGGAEGADASAQNAGDAASSGGEPGGGSAEAAAPEYTPRYYYTPGCKSCNRFLRDAGIKIEKRDITEARYYEELQDLLAERGTALKEIPVFVTSADVFQGEDEVIAGYTAIIEGGSADTDAGKSGGTPAGPAGGISLSLPAVIAAGLLDGVNPCAFTTLIFLLSALSVAGRSRRETLIIGMFFTVTVFATYYLIGLGFFKIIRIADSFELVSRILRWLLFSVLLVFAFLSFYDFYKIRTGRATEIVLQLSDSVKRRMHSSIRSYSKSAALAGSSIVMGFLISIFELGCTGQIYFPTITYIIQTDKAASGFFYLGLYNLAFILPLAVVFIVVYLGIGSRKITKLFQSNLGVIKILTGLLFLGFAALMIVL